MEREAEFAGNQQITIETEAEFTGNQQTTVETEAELALEAHVPRRTGRVILTYVTAISFKKVLSYCYVGETKLVYQIFIITDY